MAHYFVTMDLDPDAYPQLPTDGLAKIVREAILPSVEALVPLSASRKLVTRVSGRGEDNGVRLRGRIRGGGARDAR